MPQILSSWTPLRYSPCSPPCYSPTQISQASRNSFKNQTSRNHSLFPTRFPPPSTPWSPSSPSTKLQSPSHSTRQAQGHQNTPSVYTWSDSSPPCRFWTRMLTVYYLVYRTWMGTHTAPSAHRTLWTRIDNSMSWIGKPTGNLPQSIPCPYCQYHQVIHPIIL